jgi:flagellar motor protein MotB
VDFSSPETGKALEALFAARFGADALQALKAELTAADEKEKKDAAAKGAAAAPAGADDPGRHAKILFERLAAVEPVDDGALTRLADARAQAVVAELGAGGRIPAERLAIKPSAAVDVKDPVSALLDLEAGR